MPERMTTLEIEDVLSSIRRLVSDEEPKPVEVIESAERFVLTPAFRVPADQVESAVVETADPVEASTDVQTEDIAESIQLFLDEADKSEAIEAELDGPSANDDEPLQETLVDQADIAEIEAPQPEIASFRSKAEAEPAELFAQLETAVGQVNEEWEPDGSEPEAGELPEQHIFASYRSRPGPVEVVLEPSTSAEDIDEPAAEREAVSPEVEAQVAEPEIADTLDATNPYVELTDAAIEQDVQPEVETEAAAEELVEVEVPIADEAEPETEEANMAGVAAFGASAADNGADSEESELADQLLDEDSLRELVAEIVREELQGTLGERITRNVRRMVRREVQRALALKEFE